jgi:hypothetical protein
MSARTATKAGNWSDVSVWDGGASVPGSGDTADSNGWAVTIDTNVDLSPGGALINTNAVGGFACSTARTITANITATVAGVLTLSNAAGVTVTIIGALTGGSTAGCTAVLQTVGTGTIAITGNVTGGSANNSRGLYLGAAGFNCTVNGTVTGGTVISSASGITVNATGTLTVTAAGGVHGGNPGEGISINQGPTINITGDCTAGSGNYAYAVNNLATATVTITGNAIGGTAWYCHGVRNAAAGTINITMSAIGGSGTSSHGAINAGTGIVSCNTAVGGSVSGTNVGLYGDNINGTTTFKIIGSQANGNSALGGFCKMVEVSTVNKATFKRSSDGADSYLSNDYPAITDVKSGTTYKLGTLLGTLSSGGANPLAGKL